MLVFKNKNEGQVMNEINSFKKGIKAGFPICVGYFPVSFAFGIFSVENGLSVKEEIVPISARLIANKASFKFKTRDIETLVEKLAETSEAL